MLTEKIKALAAQITDELIAFRRDLHMHPELSNEEHYTASRIAEELDKIVEHVKAVNFHNFKLAIDEEISPRMNLDKNPDELADMMFTNGHVEAFDDAQPDVNIPMEEVPRVRLRP